ncbi:hypothetical protein C789_4920 [Microcystis aeruginosa FACHB-905 = DIANCHI905]|nr:hypothetical protein C789_4920 [Microcystis aeruginosa FACHB-905 = DIANCHI905]
MSPANGGFFLSAPIIQSLKIPTLTAILILSKTALFLSMY